MKTLRVGGGLTAASLMFLATFSTHAQWFDQGPVLTVTEENDVIARTDRHYSQGFKISYLHRDNSVPEWLKNCADSFPSWGYTPEAVKIGTQFGQSIYTPHDLDAPGIVTNDRPYAGWLYTGFIVQRRGLTDGNRPVLENFQLDLGIVGCESLAEAAQDWTHDDPPNGWDNQLETEVGFAFKYMRAWLFSPQRKGSRCFDFIPHVGFSLGNIDTSFRIGGTVRLGVNLPDDFGVQNVNSLATPEGGLSPSRENSRWGFYVFGSAEGSAVAYNQFIDGNMFRSSHDVSREPLVGELEGGAVFVMNHLEIGASIVWRTEEFERQDEAHVFGSLFLKVKL
jgi:lipid A 3-O-deacylase